MRICLSMIVRNEAHVIERCLRSVLPFIDAWAIVDTGSGDGTQELVRRALAHLPGELVEHAWVDFATNRNQALALARGHGDYALIIDADDVLECDADLSRHDLDAPGYLVEIVHGTSRYRRVALARLDADWTWRGVLHEALVGAAAVDSRPLPGVRIRMLGDGARSQRPPRDKYLHDADVLRAALAAEPDNARYVFYLAQSLRDAGELEESIETYRRRVAMGGWAEEVYFSLLQVAVLSERAGAAHAGIVAAYVDAYDFRPARAEAPCDLARYLRLQRRYAVARDFARTAALLPPSDDVLFIDQSVHDWRARDEWSVSSYWCGDYATCATLCRELLANPRLPDGERERVSANLAFCRPHVEA